MDVGAHDVQAGGAGRQPHAVLPTLPDDFGFFQCQFINARHDDAVARGLDLVKGGFDLVIGALGPGQADDAGQKACLVHDVQPGLFTEDLIENIRGDGSGDADTAAGQIHAGQAGGGDVFTPQLRALACKIGHPVHRGSKIQHGRVDRALQPVPAFEHRDPGGHLHGNLADRELVQKRLQ